MTLKKIAFAFVLAVSLHAAAQPYPAKPVRIIVPFAPGGGTDFIARFMAQRLSAALGQQFVVENRAGAGSTIGTEAGLKSAPDGYTLIIISNSYAANASLYKLRFDPIADMTPIGHPSILHETGTSWLTRSRSSASTRTRPSR